MITAAQAALGKVAVRVGPCTLPPSSRWRPHPEDPTAIQVAVLEDGEGYVWSAPCHTTRSVRRAAYRQE